MKIDWKHLCKTPGYISLKQAVVDNFAKNKWRNKAESYKLFYYTINRAKHYAQVQNLPIEDILNIWEAARGHQWIMNYYPASKHDSHFRRLDRTCLTVKPMKPINYHKKTRWADKDPVRRKKQSLKIIMRQQQLKSKRKDKKERWNTHRKEHAKRMKKYELDTQTKSVS